MSEGSWTERVEYWLDAGQELDPFLQTRLRGIQVVVAMLMVFGLPWIGVTFMVGFTTISLAVLVAVALGPVVIWLARNGRLELASHMLMSNLLVGVSVGIWQRGGLEFSASAWLAMVPVFAFLFLGLRGGILWSVGTAVCAMAHWLVEGAGWVAYPELTPAWHRRLVILDYVSLPIVIAAGMWSHWTGQVVAIAALDSVNEALRVEVSERKRAEETAKAAVRARDRFFATMSHEIRTPLNGVLGLSEVLVGTDLSQDQQELATMVQGSGQLLRSLLDDVLDYSKIDGEQLVIEERAIELRPLCAKLLKAASIGVDPSQVDLVCEVSPDCPAWVLGDSVRLSQVLGNLLSNSSKFTELGRVTLRAFVSPDGLRFAVEDTGIGMSQEQIERVFEPFAQADVSTTRRFGGTGLGLTISKGLVDAMGGQITVKSVVGQGTVFEVELPLVGCPPPVAEDKVLMAPRALKGLRILVAEDNRVNQVVIERFLQQLGVSVDLVQDGLECIAAWERLRPDLILMDCQMPEMDGFRATAEIRARGGTLPIIALTANTSPQDRLQSLEAGMNDHLGKPVSLPDLAACLVRCLAEGQKAAVSEEA